MSGSSSFVYAVLCAPCLPVAYDDDNEDASRKNIEVVVRFDSEEQMNDEADNFFDNIYGTFQQGLDQFQEDPWFVDEAPEISRTISLAEAEERGYVVFVSD